MSIRSLNLISNRGTSAEAWAFLMVNKGERVEIGRVMRKVPKQKLSLLLKATHSTRPVFNTRVVWLQQPLKGYMELHAEIQRVWLKILFEGSFFFYCRNISIYNQSAAIKRRPSDKQYFQLEQHKSSRKNGYVAESNKSNVLSSSPLHFPLSPASLPSQTLRRINLVVLKPCRTPDRSQRREC